MIGNAFYVATQALAAISTKNIPIKSKSIDNATIKHTLVLNKTMVYTHEYGFARSNFEYPSLKTKRRFNRSEQKPERRLIKRASNKI